MSERPIILTFARHYLPGFKGGGPIRSISNMVEGLSDEFDFRIVTSDRDHGETTSYSGIELNRWTQVGKASVLYLPRRMRSVAAVSRLLSDEPHHLLYLNSFFDPEFTLKPLLARNLTFKTRVPALLAPRGELSSGSRQVKAKKKKLFLALARPLRIYRDLKWHASSERDKADIVKVICASPTDVHVAPNLSAPLAHHSPSDFAPRRPNAPLRVCFLSRISPEKNLEFALRVMSQVTLPIRFDIYGPIGGDAAYWARCRNLMEQLPQWITVDYRGSVEPPNVSAVLADNDLLLLPTQGENYGHVIMEALSVGTPVLIADTTPWRELVTSGVGWDLPLACPGDFADKLEVMSGMPIDEQLAMRRRVLAYAASKRQDGDAAGATYRLLRQVLGSKPTQPE